jgi:uncharacterized protein DUF2752
MANDTVALILGNSMAAPMSGTEIPSDCPSPDAAPKKPHLPDWQFHAIWLVLPALAIGLSLVLEIRDSRQVIVPVLAQPLPELCSFRRVLGIDCAGCGLTRSFISIGHLRLADAWSYHPAGPVLYALALFQLPYRSVQLWRLSRGQRELRLGQSANGVIFALAVLLLVVWIVRIWGRILL